MRYEMDHAIPLERLKEAISAVRSLTLSWSGKLAIDLGTSNTLIYAEGSGIVLNEPSLIAFNESDGQIAAAGRVAKQMIGRAPRNIRVVRPLQEGVIADSEAAEKLLAAFIRRVLGRRALLHPNALICVPCEITEVERRAVEDAVRRAGAHEVSLIEKPFAAAAGTGIDQAVDRASMIVTIGGGTTDVAVLSFGGLVHAGTLRAGGMKLDQAIAQHLHKTRSVEVGETTAELIKLKLASVSGETDKQVLEIGGRSLNTRLPVRFSVTREEVRAAIEPLIREFISTVRNVIEELPPEVAADLLESGIILTGGGAQLPGLPELLNREIGLEVRVADNPTLAAVLGAGRLLRPGGSELEMKPLAGQIMPGLGRAATSCK